MGLMEFIERHAGKLALVGTIGVCSSFYYENNKNVKFDEYVEKMKQSIEYVRFEEVNKEISHLERELNKGVTLRDAIALTGPESAERNKYLEMQRRYNLLEEERETLMQNLEIRITEENVVKGRSNKNNITPIFLLLNIISIFPTSFGYAGLINRFCTKKQKPFLT